VRVSVIIPCHNSASHLEATVRSALAQTVPPHEIICIDDASTDDTWSILLSLRAGAGGVLRVARNERNRGIPAAVRNQALALATGDWVAFLDHDDLWLPNKLEAQADEIRRSPRADMVHGECWIQEQDDTSRRTLAHAGRAVPTEAVFRAVVHWNFVRFATAMVRREALERLGGLNEARDIRGVDDYDLWLRLARVNGNFAFVADPVAVWRRHGGNLGGDLALSLRGRVKVLRDIAITDPDAVRVVGAAEFRRRLLGLRLQIVEELLRAGAPGEARAALRSVWTTGWREAAIWQLRGALLARRLSDERARRAVGECRRRYRRLSRLAFTAACRRPEGSSPPPPAPPAAGRAGKRTTSC
jgi:glycosyltransferase involved in cell wall biosynthesis